MYASRSSCSEKRNSESTQNQRANSQCDAPIACKPSAAHKTSQSSDTYGIFDAFFAFVGGAESSGHLGNLCFTHFWFRLPLVASAASFHLPVGKVSFCCVAEERLSDLLPATAAGGHFFFVATKPDRGHGRSLGTARTNPHLPGLGAPFYESQNPPHYADHCTAGA